MVDSGWGGGSNGISLGEGGSCVTGFASGIIGTVGPRRGDSAGVWGRLGMKEGRPMEPAIEDTGLRLYLEVGGKTGTLRVDVMEDLDEGLIIASSETVSWLLEF